MLKKSRLILIAVLFFFFTKDSIAVVPNFNTGIGRSGNSGLNISADTPGPIKYQLEFKPLGGGRKVSANTYDDASKNLAMTVNVNCLDGAGCTADETLVRGVYIAGTEGGYAVAKRFTLFCGSIQVTAEQRTDTWTNAFYQSFADDFLNNGPSSGNCASPTPQLSPTAVVAVSSVTTAPTAPARRVSRTPTLSETEPTDEPVPTPFQAETPTPTPEEEGSGIVAGFVQNLPAIVAGIILTGVLGFVLYRTNPGFRAFIDRQKGKFAKPQPPPASPSAPVS